MNLTQLSAFLSNYFFSQKLYLSGYYWCEKCQIRERLDNDHLIIGRPGEDCFFSITQQDNRLFLAFGESYMGSELFTLCLLPGQEFLAVIELAQNAQRVVQKFATNWQA